MLLLKTWSQSTLVLLGLITSLLALQVQAESAQTKTWPPSENSNTYILRYDSIVHPVLATSAMVVSQNTLASNAGKEILSEGGNAVDAAVATAFALAVTLPRAGNLGGGGFMLVHMKANGPQAAITRAIDFRGEAPALANQAFYTKQGKIDRDLTKTGHTASTVPGTVAGLYAAHKRWGKLPWSQLLKPAIRLSEQGIRVSQDLAWALNAKALVLSANPTSCELYFSGCERYAKAGDLLKQTDLAQTLKTIAAGGANAFYRGKIAKKIVDDMKQNGGLLRLADLAAYEARVIEPINTDYRGYNVTTMPPPAGGMPLLQILNIMETFPISEYGAGSSKAVHIMSEAMKRAYAYRYRYLGDPRFTDVPVSSILDKAFAKKLARQINLTQATPIADIQPYLPKDLPDSPNTTHLSVIDSEGNGVAMTYTLSASFGSGVIIKDTGILMNNQMNNYSYRTEMDPEQYRHLPNGLASGKRPKSTQAPTFIFDKGELMLLTGTPGGRRIITTVAQVISNLIDHKMNIAEATQFPRIHQGWRSEVLSHEPGFSPDTLERLTEMGHVLKEAATMGSTQSIYVVDKQVSGAADTRRPNAKAVPL